MKYGRDDSYMKLTQLAGGWALFAVLLSACGTETSVNSVEVDSALNQSTTQNSEESSNTEQSQPIPMNEQTMLMNSTFLGLTMMDSQEGLAITQEQAEYMLPIVEVLIEAGEITEENKTTLLAKLTAEQLEFLNTNESKLNSGNREGGTPPEVGVTDNGEKPQMGERPVLPEGEGNVPTPPDGGAQGEVPANGGQAGANSERPVGGPIGGGMDKAGEQFITLLKSKLS